MLTIWTLAPVWDRTGSLVKEVRAFSLFVPLCFQFEEGVQIGSLFAGLGDDALHLFHPVLPAGVESGEGGVIEG